MPRVTVCIPAFNSARFIGAAVASVLAQDWPEVELFVCDDGSTDDTAAVATAAASAATGRVTVLRNPANLGIAGNWNRCLALGSGEFVTLLHGDDALEPDYVSRCVEMLARHPTAVLVHTNLHRVDGDGRRFGEHWAYPEKPGDECIPGAEVRHRIFSRGNFICCPSVMFRRSRLPAGFAFDERYRYALDIDAWLRLSLAGEFAFVGTPLIAYRVHNAQQTHRLEPLVKEGEVTDALVRFAATSGMAPIRGLAARRALHYALRCRQHGLPWGGYVRTAWRLQPAALLHKDTLRLLLARRRRGGQ